MTDPRPETLVERLYREFVALGGLRHRHKTGFAVVLLILVGWAATYLVPIFRGATPTIESAFDPDRVFVVKALVKSPTSGKEHFDYFIKVDGDTWFEVYSEPSFTT